jgi:hypothetical protein
LEKLSAFSGQLSAKKKIIKERTLVNIGYGDDDNKEKTKS